MTDPMHTFDSLLDTGKPSHAMGHYETTVDWDRQGLPEGSPDIGLQAADQLRVLFQNFHEGVAKAQSLDAQTGAREHSDTIGGASYLIAELPAPSLAPRSLGASFGEYILRVIRPEAREYLAEALEDLRILEVGGDEEEDMPPPKPGAVKTARQILRHVIWESPRRFGVSSWEDGAVALGASGGHGHLLSVFCDADGAVSVFRVRPGGGTDEKHCPPHEDPPIEYISEALRHLPPGE